MEAPLRARLVCATLLALCGSLLLVPTSLVQAQAAPAVDAKIEIVWPHDRQGRQMSADAATLVNVEVYLFQRGTLNPVGCDFANTVRLRWALNAGGMYELPPYTGFGEELPTDEAVPGYGLPAEAVGQKLTRTVAGMTFPYWSFNDVPVFNGIGEAKPGTKATYFVVEVDGADYRTTVWGHAANPRTFLPTPLVPQSLAGANPSAGDAMIQVVYPHDRQGRYQPAAQAPLVNVGVDLFQHPVPFEFPSAPPHPASVAFGFGNAVRLFQSLNSGYLDPVKPADMVTMQRGTTSGGAAISWPRWQFNDLNVSAASDPANTYYFTVQVDGVTTHTTIWAHGADPRTSFPRRDVPTSSGAGC